MKNTSRIKHTGKSLPERQAYKDFLASEINLDKTVIEPQDIDKTSESSFEEEKPEIRKIKKKSKWLKIKDFFSDNMITAIISGLILFIIGGFITINREQGVQGEKISKIEENVGNIVKTNDGNGKSFLSLKEDFLVFKAETKKDLEFIKKKLKL